MLPPQRDACLITTDGCHDLNVRSTGCRSALAGQSMNGDIDSKRMLIHVRTGKTGPRYVTSPSPP